MWKEPRRALLCTRPTFGQTGTGSGGVEVAHSAFDQTCTIGHRLGTKARLGVERSYPVSPPLLFRPARMRGGRGEPAPAAAQRGPAAGPAEGRHQRGAGDLPAGAAGTSDQGGERGPTSSSDQWGRDRSRPGKRYDAAGPREAWATWSTAPAGKKLRRDVEQVSGISRIRLSPFYESLFLFRIVVCFVELGPLNSIFNPLRCTSAPRAPWPRRGAPCARSRRARASSTSSRPR